jgi:GT2 family glycosyltransferase
MNTISIGIYVDGQLERLRWTLASLKANTCQDAELLLLLDGVALNETAMRSLPAWNRAKVSATSDARGAAACFNRLASQTETGVLVLLESGVIVAPGWLDRLLAALASDPHNGLAGPSTNNSWNEQCAFPCCSGNTAQIAATAHEAARRFGSEVRTLDPLYSLGDFCYAVRREVVDAIGAADESYALGPCWEMDYNIRAARAGWRGVWAGGAFVYRPAFSARRRFEEGRRFATSKRLYQDKFCGGRLRGQKTDYREHCRGEACPNFAPADLIELKRVLPAPASASTRSPTWITDISEPLVTCIMPTHNRRSFVPQAIRCFLRQDY